MLSAWPPRWRSRTACARPPRSCSNRLWRSKWKRRKRKWAMSWATCRRVAALFRAWKICLATRQIFHALNNAATRRQVAHDIAHFLFRRFHFDRHNRFEQDRGRLAHAVLERHRGGHAECIFVRVHLVIRAVEQRHLYVHHGVAGKHAGGQRFQQAPLYRRNVLSRHRAALDGVDKLETFSGRLRLDLEPDVAVLATPAGLLDELAFDFLAHAPDGLAVGHLW